MNVTFFIASVEKGYLKTVLLRPLSVAVAATQSPL